MLSRPLEGHPMSILDAETLPPLVTLDTAAELLSISKDTLRRMISRGEIEAVRIGPRLLRVRTESLFALGTPLVTASAA